MSERRSLHIPMSTVTKRAVFFSLFVLFIVYSFFIAGAVTEYEKGKELYTEDAKAGKLLFQNYNCIACHQVYGLGGYMGPDLTNVMSSKGKNEVYVSALLKYGTQRMPNFQLNDKEIVELTSYLRYLDKTGSSPVKEFTVNIQGTIATSKNEE